MGKTIGLWVYDLKQVKFSEPKFSYLLKAVIIFTSQ